MAGLFPLFGGSLFSGGLLNGPTSLQPAGGSQFASDGGPPSYGPGSSDADPSDVASSGPGGQPGSESDEPNLYSPAILRMTPAAGLRPSSALVPGSGPSASRPGPGGPSSGPWLAPTRNPSDVLPPKPTRLTPKFALYQTEGPHPSPTDNVPPTGNPGQGQGIPPGPGGTPPGQGGLTSGPWLAPTRNPSMVLPSKPTLLTPPIALYQTEGPHAGPTDNVPPTGSPGPGQGTPPGQGGTPPGQGGTPPGQGGTPPQDGTPPGPGDSGGQPGPGGGVEDPTGPGEPTTPPDTGPVAGYTEIGPEEALKIMRNEPDVYVLDVRRRKDYLWEHITGAEYIPEAELADRLAEIPEDAKGIIVYGKNDAMSARAAQLLAEAGLENIMVLKGGLEDWTGPTKECAVCP